MGSGEYLSIEIVLIIGNSLSLLGSLFIICLFIIFSSIRSYAFKLVVYMSVADAIRSIGYIIPNNSDALCLAQAVLTNFGSLSGVIWTSIIAFSIYCVVVLEMEIQSFEKFMILIGFILPFCITMLPFTTSSYGRAEGWCWVKLDQFELVWRIFAFYAIVFVSIVFNSVMYYQVIKELKLDIGYLRSSSHHISEKKAVHTRFSFYPLIIIICYTPVLIKRIIEAATSESFFALNIISAIFMSSIGILNAITYGFTDNVKEVLFGGISRASSIESYTGINNGLVNEVTEDDTSYRVD
jgi:hypothetical protein